MSARIEMTIRLEPRGWAFSIWAASDSPLANEPSYIAAARYGFETREEAEAYGRREIEMRRAGEEYEAKARALFATGLVEGLSTRGGKMEILWRERRGQKASAA